MSESDPAAAAHTPHMDTVTVVYNSAIILLEIACIIVYTIYFLAHFAHPEDTPFARSFIGRFFIFIGFVISYVVVFSVQFDV